MSQGLKTIWISACVGVVVLLVVANAPIWVWAIIFVPAIALGLRLSDRGSSGREP